VQIIDIGSAKNPLQSARPRFNTDERDVDGAGGNNTALKFTSCQAPITDLFCDAVARTVGERLGMRTQFVRDVPWQEREHGFDLGEIEVCWMCGWPYAVRADSPSADLDLIAAPVMAGPRYLDQPVYFSDVVVRTESPFKSFEDLRGKSWAYNEPMSHSGYHVVRHFLATQKRYGGFFGSVVESGSHQASVDLILSGVVDGSAIDSTVLEAILRLRPELTPLLRVIETLGPSPSPPWVMHSSTSRDLRDAVRKEFLTMHERAEGRAILEGAGVRRFAAVDDHYYDAIREMAAAGAHARLSPLVP
jgi:phosphonate transport system substrate-binding protein